MNAMLERWRGVSQVWLRLLPFLGGMKREFAAAALASLVFVTADLIRPWPIKIVIDQVILQQEWQYLPRALAGPEKRTVLLLVCCASLLLLAALAGAAGHWRTLLLAKGGQKVVARVRKRVFRRLLDLSLAYHDRHPMGDLVVRLTGDCAMMRTLLVEGLFALVQEMALFLGVFCVMLMLDLELTLLAGLFVPTVCGVIVVYSRRLRRAARRQRKKEGLIASSIGESLPGLPVIQAFGLEDAAEEKFRRQNKKSLKAGLAATRYEDLMGRWTEMAIALGTAILLLLGSFRVLSGELSAGELVVLLSYVRSLFRPLRRMASRTARLLKSSASGERILEILDTPLDVVDAPTVSLPSPVRGAVEFRQIHFGYGDVDLFQGFDLAVAAGEKVAIVGPNGAGKSTLLSFLPRLREPRSGAVCVDGIDIRSVPLTDLRRCFGVVLQDTVLFDGSIRENVLLALPEASDSDFTEAVRRSGLEETLRKLPRGLGTPVGSGGTMLSGGQRQRVALARALLRRAPILLLDEPTTSLDHQAEAVFGRQILTGLEGQTVLLITHRFESLAAMDRVLVLDHGRIQAEGTPQEVWDALPTSTPRSVQWNRAPAPPRRASL